MIMLDDGNLSQFDSAGNVIWSTDTENARGGKGKGNHRRTASIDVRLQNVTSEQVVWKPPVGVEVHIQSSPGEPWQQHMTGASQGTLLLQDATCRTQGPTMTSRSG